MGYLGQLLFIIGLGAGIYGIFESITVVLGTQEPEVVTIEQAGSADGVGNIHLTITDFAFGDKTAISSEKGEWRRVCVPLLKSDATWTERPIVVYSYKIKSSVELERVLDRKKVTGINTNHNHGLSKDAREELESHYPGADLSNAIAFELDANYPSPWIVLPMAILGTCLGIYGLCLALGWIGASHEPEFNPHQYVAKTNDLPNQD